ncbi:hypothetical protein [Sorangium cellulosum]|uniref:hypothetical protein n=1 Tax=Sorangium cellulosum TaxID=56 RepID=UPI000A8787A3|nr:hypothetical protein [Sorangium cellulosum]
MQQNERDDPAIAPIHPALAGPQRWPGRPPLSLTLDRGTGQESPGSAPGLIHHLSSSLATVLGQEVQGNAAV